MSNRNQPRLADVIRRLPTECYRIDTRKSRLVLASDLVLYSGAVTGLAFADQPWLLIPLWILAALSISGLFILAHDAAHGVLFRSDRSNIGVGKLAMLPSLHLFEAWCFGHNRIHHGHTARESMDFSWHPVTPRQYRQLSAAGKLGHRLKWSCLGAGIYYLHEVWWKKMIRFQPSNVLRKAVRRDRAVVGGWMAIVSLTLLQIGHLTYGTAAGALWMWLKVLVVPFLLFSWAMGAVTYVQHIGPEIAWLSRTQSSKAKGPMECTSILYVPRVLNFFLHNILIHVPHHVDSRIPFYNLPSASDVILEHYGDLVHARRFRFRDYLQSTKQCKLFEFERGVWLDYQGRTAEEAPQSRWSPGARSGARHLADLRGNR